MYNLFQDVLKKNNRKKLYGIARVVEWTLKFREEQSQKNDWERCLSLRGWDLR